MRARSHARIAARLARTPPRGDPPRVHVAAYVGVGSRHEAHPGEAHAPAFLICRACQSVAEAAATSARSALEAEAAQLGFTIERSTIEALGLCPACQEQP